MTLKLTKTAQPSKFLYRNRVTDDRRMPIPFLGVNIDRAAFSRVQMVGNIRPRGTKE